MKNNDIKIKQGASSLSEFVQRPLADDEAVEAFDQYVANEAKAEEIKDSLEKIYQDADGNKIDVKRIDIKPKRGLFFNLFTFLIVVFAVGGAIYASYNYLYLKITASRPTVAITVEAKKEIAAGQEFYYNLNYKNEDRVGLKNIEIKAKYPDNFIFISSEPSPSKNNDTWKIDELAPHRGDSIRIKGKLINTEGSANIILADLTYTPENFSSEFKKSASWETKINGLGLDYSFINSGSATVGEENEIIVKFKAKAESFLNNFRLSVEYPDFIELLKSDQVTPTSAVASGSGPIIQASGLNSWLVSNLGKNENEFKIKFKVKEKKQSEFDLKLKFDYAPVELNLPAPPTGQAGQPPKYYLFYEKNLTYEVISSDLNINLIINGSALDQSVNFGQTLNYSINYKNTGANSLKDLIIMAILQSDFLDWPSLADPSGGQVSGNTISWSKNEIPALAELASGAENVIDFSLKLKGRAEIDLSKTYQVKSYVKYGSAGKNAPGDSQSNIITNKINSDLDLTEEVRYFSDDNLAVGSGPLPPKVGQTTSLKIYWTINNNLHELTNAVISVSLPPSARWDGKNRSSVGSLIYDGQNNKVIWQIDKLPVSAYKADAEFNLALSPAESDRNKIMLVLPGTVISAVDNETNAQINQTLKAKTTKLEDDNLANTDGVVQ